MKKILRSIFLILLLLLVGFTAFFIWAKQAKLSLEEYSKIIEHNNAVFTETDSVFTVMSYNIGYLSGMTNNMAVRPKESFFTQNMDEVLDLLKESSVDIIGFQEIDFDSKRSYYVNQNQRIADRLFAYSVPAVNWDKNYVPFPYWPISANFGSLLSGQSVMSNYELTNDIRIVLQKVESNPFYYNAFYLDRLAQVVTVKHPVKDITLINIHTEAFDQATRTSQLEKILELFEEKAKYGPVLLLGDFNSDPNYENAACKLFLNHSLIACAGSKENDLSKKTYPSNQPAERLDYIFYTKQDFTEIKAGVAAEYGTISDHLPVFAKLKFKKGKTLIPENIQR